MILSNLAVLCLGIVWFKGVCGASYSQVYVHNGYNYPVPTVPTVAYGAPPATPDSGTSQNVKNAPPINSVVPYPYPASFAPCVIPCIPVPSTAYGQPYTPVEKARLIYNPAIPTQQYNPYRTGVAYNIPSAPVLAPAAPAGYEYSYVVYDDNAGALKTQHQWSNVVQGQYSFRQPFQPNTQPAVGQVQYTAEDLKGFNAVVKHYLPTALPNYYANIPGVKPIVLIRAEPCDPPTASNSTSNATKPSDTNKKTQKTSRSRITPKSLPIEEEDEESPPELEVLEAKSAPIDLIEEIVEETEITSTPTTESISPKPSKISETATTTTTTELPQSETKPKENAETEIKTEVEILEIKSETKDENPEIKAQSETDKKEVPSSKLKVNVKVTEESKPKRTPRTEDVSEPEVAASNAYANAIRCIQKSMIKPGQGASPLTYIISPLKPC